MLARPFLRSRRRSLAVDGAPSRGHTTSLTSELQRDAAFWPPVPVHHPLTSDAQRLGAALADRYRIERALGTDRFLAEIKTTAKLQHPHIWPLLNWGEADRLLFCVMPMPSASRPRSRAAGS
jgi:hypothetical protein